MIGLALPITWMNERREVRMHKVYTAGKKNVINVSPTEIYDSNNYRLVHFTGVLG